MLCPSSGRTISVATWPVRGEGLWNRSGDDGDLTDVGFSPDSVRVVTGGADGMVLALDIAELLKFAKDRVARAVMEERRRHLHQEICPAPP